MPIAPILDLRQAIVLHLRADAAVTATSISDRIYGEKAPAAPVYPFLRYGASDATRGEITAPLHIFSKDAFTDDVNAIAQAVVESLDLRTVMLGSRKAYLTCTSVRVVGDAAEASQWHAIVTVVADIPPDCAS